MELKKISNQELLSRLDKLVRTERKLTHVILCHINEVESRRLYAEMGFDSMFKYLTSHCGYGEDSAYRRLQAARLLKKTPEIAEKLQEGTLNLTQLTQVQKCIRQEQQSGGMVSSAQTLQILEQIENKSAFETKKVLALEFNQPIQTHEVVMLQQDDSVRLELTFTHEQMKVLKQAKDLLSHTMPDGSWADVIALLAEKHMQKTLGKNQSGNEPKAPNNSKDSRSNKKSTPSFTAKPKRGHIKITVRRRVFQKAHHCCEFIDPKTQRKCQSNYQLEVDHRIPLARGGSDKESNLRVLCRTHNLLAAKQWGLKSKKPGHF
ncbi:MAG: HNH endonuclease [Bdellovibrionales bacterium]|nr:HNH endonuclease [Bdellovibrionales bacterium]